MTRGIWIWLALVTTATARPYEECPIIKVTLGENGGVEAERFENPHSLDDAIKYWTGSKVYVARRDDKLRNGVKLENRHKLQDAVLTKKVLGPVAVLINFALSRTIRGVLRIRTPPRAEYFSKLLLELSKGLAADLTKKYPDDINSSLSDILRALADPCGGEEKHLAKYEALRKLYEAQLTDHQNLRTDFEGGKPPFFRSYQYRRRNKKLRKWTRDDALAVGILQVKCHVLGFLSQDPAWGLSHEQSHEQKMSSLKKKKDSYLELPDVLSAVLSAKIGVMKPLVKILSSQEWMPPWKLDPPPRKDFVDLGHLVDVVALELTHGKLAELAPSATGSLLHFTRYKWCCDTDCVGQYVP